MENKEAVQQLVFAAKNGNETCFAQLYEMYYQKVYALARATLKNDADAEDILQRTFIKAWQSIGNLEDTAAFHTWIQRITVNECYSFLRARKQDISLDASAEDENSEPFQIESDLMLPTVYAEQEDLKARLDRILNDLSGVQRQTIQLYYYDGLSVEEIASTMGCSENTVKSRLFLARKAIKNEVEAEERKTGQKFFGVGCIPLARLFFSRAAQFSLSPSSAASLFSGITAKTAGAAASLASGATAAGAKAVAAQPVKAAVGQAIGQTGRTFAAQPAKAAVGQAVGQAGKVAAAQPAKMVAGQVAGHTGKAVVAQSAKVVAGQAVKSAGKAVAAKIVAGIAAVGIVAGGTVGTMHYLKNRDDVSDSSQPESSYTASLSKTSVDPDSLPESLSDFLTSFVFGYQAIPETYDPKSKNIYDAAHASDGSSNILVSLMKTAPCVWFGDYPVKQPDYRIGPGPIPNNTENYYARFPGESVDWMAKKIFNITEEDLAALQKQGEEKKWFYMDRKSDGSYDYLIVSSADIGGPYTHPIITSAEFDGKKYYVSFDMYGDDISDDYCYKMSAYAEMEEKTIDGKSYWSLYHYEVIDEEVALPNADPAIEVYKQYLESSYQKDYQMPLEAFAFYDLNQDGSPELITRGGGQMDYYKVFTYKNAKVELLHSGTTCSLYDNGTVCFGFNAGAGYFLTSYYSVDEKLDMKLLFRYADWFGGVYTEGENADDENSPQVPYATIEQKEKELLSGTKKAELAFAEADYLPYFNWAGVKKYYSK